MFFKSLLNAALLFPSATLAFTLITSNMKGWSKDEVSFYLNPANCSVSIERIEEAIDRAVNLWNSVPSSRLKVSYFGQTASTGLAADPIIGCVTSGISGAVGVGIISTAGGLIQTGEIQLNSMPGDVGNIAVTTDAQLDIALAHEMGHVFGLGHSTVESSLMYFALGQKEHLALSQDDIDGMTWLYPRNEPRDGFLGCGSLGSGGPENLQLLWILAMAGWLGFLMRMWDRGNLRTAGFR
jgi:hypothetical protein